MAEMLNFDSSEEAAMGLMSVYAGTAFSMEYL
jgi:hypothetical protein